MNVEDLGMAPFRNSKNPKLFEKTMGVYCLQAGIMDRYFEIFPKA